MVSTTQAEIIDKNLGFQQIKMPGEAPDLLCGRQDNLRKNMAKQHLNSLGLSNKI